MIYEKIPKTKSAAALSYILHFPSREIPGKTLIDFTTSMRLSLLLKTHFTIINIVQNTICVSRNEKQLRTDFRHEKYGNVVFILFTKYFLLLLLLTIYIIYTYIQVYTSIYIYKYIIYAFRNV